VPKSQPSAHLWLCLKSLIVLIQTELQPGHTPRIKKLQNRFNGFLFSDPVDC